MRNKLCFIIPYFGHFPNYFNLFLQSCSFNPDFHWLIYTDDNYPYTYPANVECHLIDFHSFVEKIREKFDFPIALNRPYKLCDFKPAYGYLFEEHLTRFQYWGYCDTDVIFGDLSQFLTDDLLEKYDKLFCLGHMTIFKNTKQNNRLFMSEYQGRKIYKDVLQSQQNCWFDEEYKDENNINQIFLTKGKRVYTMDLSLNISQHFGVFRRTIYQGIDRYSQTHGYETEQYNPSVYVWNHGHLIRYRKSEDSIESVEFPYIHLQGRKMSIDKAIVNQREFQIVPNRFIPMSQEITKDSFDYVYKGDGLQNRILLVFNRFYKRVVIKLKRII